VRIGIVSKYAYELSFALRLIAEGHEVRWWIAPSYGKGVGNGLVPKAGQWPELLAWVREGSRTGPAIMLFGTSGLGDKADEARKAGVPVVGGGTFMDKLEHDRDYGFKIAQEAGAQLPPYKEFASIDETIAWARTITLPPSFWKTDRYFDGDTTHGVDDAAHLIEYLEGMRTAHGNRMTNIVQKKIDGIPFSTARWWNGRDWVGPYEGAYENKKFMNDDVGPSTGCSFNALWFYEEEQPRIAEILGWENLSSAFRAAEAPPGLYDMNAIITDEGEGYFLEWTPRFGYDSEPTSFRLIPDLGAHLYAVAFGHTPPEPSHALAYSIRLSIPPYPWEHGDVNDKGGAVGKRIIGADLDPESSFVPYHLRMGPRGLEMASPEGLVGLAYVQGEDIHQLGEQALEAAEELKRTAGLQYRTDGAEDCAEAAHKLDEAGLEVHIGLLAEVD
jgi:phosphoribosylamine--glycine ligase